MPVPVALHGRGLPKLIQFRAELTKSNYRLIKEDSTKRLDLGLRLQLLASDRVNPSHHTRSSGSAADFVFGLTKIFYWLTSLLYLLCLCFLIPA